MIAVVIGSAWAADGATDAAVARGWYAWRTGQDVAAAEFAASAVAAAPTDLGALQLHTAMQVLAGNGFSVESTYREWWGEATGDPIRRVALATAITLRRSGSGTWCEEVERLLAPVLEGDPHYWATLTDRQRELRCTGQTGHADAELRRLAKQVEGRGWAEGVLAKLETGYIKDELPPELEKLWTEQPHHLDVAAVLWRDGVSGPGKGAAKRIAGKALDAAVSGSDPVAIHAALVAYTASGQEKQATEAATRLKTIDPKADVAVVRSTNDIRDPQVYAAVDGCTAATDVAVARSCIDALGLPATGSVAAYGHHVRRQLFEAQHLEAEAYAEAKAGYEALPNLRFGARVFAKQAVLRGADLELAAEALEVVLAGRVPAGPVEEVPQDLRAPLARDLELKVEALRKLGRPSDALTAVSLAQALQPTAARQLLVGLVQAEAGQGDNAALALSYALVAVIDDTARVTAGRDALARLGWLGSAQRMIDAAARTVTVDGGITYSELCPVLDAAGWALFSDARLSLAVARGSGQAVAQLGAVARQAGIPVSLHGTGGAWMVAADSAEVDRFAAV
ncbi:MAG: hypothetical protein ABMA64_20810, partial [Myxococcota bacterium]